MANFVSLFLTCSLSVSQCFSRSLQCNKKFKLGRENICSWQNLSCKGQTKIKIEILERKFTDVRHWSRSQIWVFFIEKYFFKVTRAQRYWFLLHSKMFFKKGFSTIELHKYRTISRRDVALEIFFFSSIVYKQAKALIKKAISLNMNIMKYD